MLTAVDKAKKEAVASTTQVCNCFNLKRDAYYKYLRRSKTRQSKTAQVVKMVQKERKMQPRVGTRQLHKDLFITPTGEFNIVVINTPMN